MSDSHRINQVSISSEGPRQTPNESFGNTLSKTLAKGASTTLGLASPLLGAVNPALSAPVSQAAQTIAQFANSGPATTPRALTSVPLPNASAPSGSSGEASIGASAGGTDSASLLQAQQAMNEQSQQFNMMYLQLQDNMQRESREYETISNIMKVRHDTAKNAINNIH
ncbi:MAG: hypothetical protein JST54_11805 [Deltaproteobacteria bacterium]|nr:hypothetical protein [Deltaproteobacteria bacterium]